MLTKNATIDDGVIYWHNATGPPADRIYEIKQKLAPILAIQILLITLAALGQLLGVAFLAFNIRNRNKR